MLLGIADCRSEAVSAGSVVGSSCPVLSLYTRRVGTPLTVTGGAPLKESSSSGASSRIDASRSPTPFGSLNRTSMYGRVGCDGGAGGRKSLATTTAPLKGPARSAVGKAVGVVVAPLAPVAEVTGPAVWSKIEKSLTLKVLSRKPPALPIVNAALPLIVNTFLLSTVTPISAFEMETSSTPLG